MGIAEESAKPLVYARAEVERAVATFRIAAAEAERFCGEVVPVDINPAAEGRRAETRREPLGVIFGITPFNFPLNLVAHKVAPAIASGNSIIIKPSEKTPLTALLLQEVIADTALPDNAAQVVMMDLGPLHEVLERDVISMISFTGSDRVGWMLKSRFPTKAFALELGGNAAVIVDETADLEDEARRICGGAFSYSGQVCISVQRVLVQKSVEEPFKALLAECAGNLGFGDPLDPQTTFSSMISSEAADSTRELIDKAVDAGAVQVLGEKGEGAYVPPTILENVSTEMEVVAKEAFAPVVTIEPFSSIDEAVATANDSIYGLQAGVFSDRHSTIERLANELEYGGVIINDVPTFRVDNMPYGGFKASGWGREGVRYAMEEMTRLKLVVTRTI